MRNLLLLAILVMLPCAARAQDPIAYSCYFCTPEETVQTAIAQGPGEHYVYDASTGSITGYMVGYQGAELAATAFIPPDWVRTQFSAMMSAYNVSFGGILHTYGRAYLYPPGSDHGRLIGSGWLWGQHTTSLSADHVAARETVRRWIAANVRLDYLHADKEQGRVLQFWFQQGGLNPITVRVNMESHDTGSVDFYYDPHTGGWEYLGARDNGNAIQESAADFSGPTGVKHYRYLYSDGVGVPHFLERAKWAGVQIQGQPRLPGDVNIRCEATGATTVCTIL